MHPALNIAIKAARRAGQVINRASNDLDLLKVATKQPNVAKMQHRLRMEGI